MFVQIHTLISLPVHIPNRGADGLAKRAVFGGVERQRISYQAQQYALRHSPAMAELEAVAGVGRTHRTALVGDRLLVPALQAAGVADADAWASAVMGLWRKDKSKDEARPSGKSKGKRVPQDAEATEDPDASTGQDVAPDKETAAPLIVGEQEIRLFTAVVRACAAAGLAPADLRGLFEKAKAPKGTPSEVTTAIEGLRTARGAIGLDGALFGRMATGIAVATVDRAVRFSDALTTHATTPVSDFFLVTDDLKDRAAGEAGGSHINTREASAGLFYRHIVVDTDQLERNGVPVEVVAPLVQAVLTVSPIGNRSPARVVEAVVEIGGQVRSLMDAFAVPVAQQPKAVAALREQVQADHDLYGAPEATLWLSEQPPVKVASLASAVGAAVCGSPEAQEAA